MSQNTATGSIYQRQSDGRWVAAVSIMGKRVVRYAGSQREARAALRDMQTAQGSGTLAPPARMTLEAWTDHWLALVGPGLRPKSLANYRQALTPIVGRLGGVRLDRLTPMQLARMFAELRAAGMGTRRIEHGYITLKTCLRYAVRLELLGVNPLDRVDRPRHRRGQRRFWTAEEAARFITTAEASGLAYAPLALFLLGTGLRLGEALGLRWSDVHWQRQAVRVERTAMHVGGDLVTNAPKTEAGKRTVTMPEMAVRALRRLPRPTEDGAIFINLCGHTPHRPQVHDALERLCARAGVPRLSPHGLRHVHAALLAAQGVDPHTLRLLIPPEN